MTYEYLDANFSAVEEEISLACEAAGRHRDSVQLITVTKTYPTELLQAVIDRGYGIMGENRPQEVMAKVPELIGEHSVHLIGQLQSNKIRKVVPLVDWIHSVDREKTLYKIEEVAKELDREINICIQVNTSGEEAKSGCAPEEAVALCKKAAELEYVKLQGLMTIGPLHGDEAAVRQSFIDLRELGEQITELVKGGRVELSMGMSGDFPMAIAEGATLIRVGSKIVGKRVY